MQGFMPNSKREVSFESTNTRKSYNIKQKMTCETPFLIYLATCKKCRGQYVGKSTTPFKKRHSNHKRGIKNLIGGLGHHYGGDVCGYENVSIQLIERVQEGDQQTMFDREIFWQNQLRCYVQNGGHAHCFRKEKKYPIS